MKSALRFVAVVAVLGGSAYAMKGCLSKADPDERLAGRFEDMCDIAKANVDSPVKGVKKLGGYLAKHLGDITGDFGDTIAMIERISDDDKHDARARVARTRIGDSVLSCAQAWNDFGEAVEASPEASELVSHTMERVSRTLEILIGNTEDFRHLPLSIEHQIDTLVR